MLLEEYHIVRLQSEILMTAEEIFGRLHGVFTRHNVPKTDRHVKTYRNYKLTLISEGLINSTQLKCDMHERTAHRQEQYKTFQRHFKTYTTSQHRISITQL